MNMLGEQYIAAPLQRVWQALNDPDVLKASIPGCQVLEKESDTRFTATVEVKVGPIGARFKGVVNLENINPPNSYTLMLQGNGGIAGSMKGAAKVRLQPKDDGTLLTYEVDAEVGGRMAQLGGPIIDATAKQLAGKFFSKFGEILGGGKTTAPAAVQESAGVAARAVREVTPVGSRQPVSETSDSRWAGIAIGLLLILVAASAFEFGRRSSAPVIVLDNALLKQLIIELEKDERGVK